jgi:putative PIN family toxin of toxin-antitoxin system
MKIVLDTNVLVSALLDADSNCGRILDLVLSGEIQIVYDSRILSEYKDVLGRSKFSFDTRDTDLIMEIIKSEGEAIIPRLQKIKLPDESDRPFVECALEGSAVLITGNKKHFQGIKGLHAYQPKEFLENRHR